ncbi:hypothetical protein AB0B51_35485 [Streptomyces griseus]|nr:hypothetical protein [Streptomyces griseus]
MKQSLAYRTPEETERAASVVLALLGTLLVGDALAQLAAPPRKATPHTA